MKHLTGAASFFFLILILLSACGGSPAHNSSLYSIEEIDGAMSIHNYGPQFGESPGAILEPMGKIGELDSADENLILFDPVDAARLPNGDILILEGRGCTVKRFSQDYEFISAFGQRGQGPGDLVSPYCLRMAPGGSGLCVGDSRISMFAPDGRYESGFKPERIAGSSIHVQYRTSGMAVLDGPLVILPSPPSLWVETGEDKLLSVYDKTGAIVRSFGKPKLYDHTELTFNANIVYISVDDNNNIYVAYACQNRISKYSQDGRLIFSADRPLPYEIKNEIRATVFKSGDMEREFLWPYVSSVSKGIHIDRKNRIWVLTYLKQPNKSSTFETGEDLSGCYEFQVFDPEGIFLFKVPFPNVRFDNFSIYGDHLYLIDAEHESCVHEFKIIDK